MPPSIETFILDLSRYFETLSPSNLQTLEHFYTNDALFKDPFNDVIGIVAIKTIFQHMFETLDQPRFVITHQLFDIHQAFMCWDFLFSLKSAPQKTYTVKGSTHLLLETDSDGIVKIKSHRDYWDPAEEIYEKIPGIGFIFRWIKKKSTAPVAPASLSTASVPRN